VLATAVIVSYNRQDVLRRQLLYYANKPIHLIFADGSDDDWGGGDAGSIGKMTWEYFRISGYNSVLKRLVEAVHRVETEFMFFIDDEECILWTGVEQAVEFLKQNPEHSCAGGRVEIANSANRRIWVDRWGHWSRPFSLPDEDPIARLISLNKAKRTANLYYQIHRTLIVKEFYKRLPDFDVRELYLGSVEIMFTGFVTLHGKWTRGDYPFWFRYGSSIAVPSTVPNFMSVSVATEMMKWFEYVLTDAFGGDDSVNTENLKIKDLKELLLGSYGEFASLPKRIRNKKNIDRNFSWLISVIQRQSKYSIKKLILMLLPGAFEKKYPDEAMRVKTYATRYAGGSKEVVVDLAKFEDIWSRFSNGLSQSQYEQELARV
jgi:glycosyltransferase domain-containing protein